MLSIIRSNLLRHNASHRHRDLLKEWKCMPGISENYINYNRC
jgi:hypothetical protein